MNSLNPSYGEEAAQHYEGLTSGSHIDSPRRVTVSPSPLANVYGSLEDKNDRFSSLMDRLEGVVSAVSASEDVEKAGPSPRESFPTSFENNMADLLSMYELRLARLQDIIDRIRL